MDKKRIKKFLSFMLALTLLSAVLPVIADVSTAPEASPAPETKQLMAVVKYTPYGRINMRAEPKEDSARVGVLSGGTLVKVYEQGTGR